MTREELLAQAEAMADAKAANYDWMEEARQLAAQCWCDPETAQTQMDVALAEAVARRIAGWMQTGALHARNEEYWRDRALKAEAMPAAAPPSAAQPVAWIQSNHLDNIRRDHRFHCSLADHKFQSDYRPLYTAPPDLAERVKELESLLRELHPYLDSLICYASTRTEYKPNDIVARIDAALAEGGEMSGHGHVTPNADGSKARCGGPGFCRECSIEAGKHWFTQQARIAALESELAQARAECERLLEVLMQMIELAEYWFTRENRQGYSEQQYQSWHSLGFGSTAMRNARAAIDAARREGK